MKETDKQKELYTSPECEVLEIKTEGCILQASGGPYPGWPGQNI